MLRLVALGALPLVQAGRHAHAPIAQSVTAAASAAWVRGPAETPWAEATWSAERFGRGRLPRIDDELIGLEWGQLQVLHTTDIHGCVSFHVDV